MLQNEKTCSRCKVTLPLSGFHNCKSSKDGKLHRCKSCSSEVYAEWRAKNPDYHANWRRENRDRIEEVDRAWREKNKDRIRKNGARWRAENPEHVREYNRLWRKENKELHRAACYAWKESNPDKVKETKRRIYEKQKDDPKHKVDSAMRAGMHVSIIRGSKAGRKWESLVGYTVDDLMRHLERQFLTGMTWGNYGRGGWHIDHKIPRSAFNYETPDDLDFNRCWALSNLQPMWEPDNISKSNKLDKPFQPSLKLAAPANDNKKSTTKKTTPPQE